MSDTSADNLIANEDSPPGLATILGLLEQVSEKFEPENSEMKQWVTQQFNNPVLVELLQDATPVMMRVLDAIGELEPVNGITISRQSGVPKGSVSKVARRLIASKLITQESIPNNKKEVLFRTTPLGKELFLAHRAFDHQMELGFAGFLRRYNDEEVAFIVRLLQDLLGTSFLYPEPQKD